MLAERYDTMATEKRLHCFVRDQRDILKVEGAHSFSYGLSDTLEIGQTHPS